jgi:hypothetical protein
MGVTAFPHPSSYPQGQGELTSHKNPDWMGIAVGGTFIAGSLLLLSGKKRAGLLVNVGALALTLLDQQDTVREWWHTLPRYIEDAQRLLDQAQHTVDDLAAKRERLRSMFTR